MWILTKRTVDVEMCVFSIIPLFPQRRARSSAPSSQTGSRLRIRSLRWCVCVSRVCLCVSGVTWCSAVMSSASLPRWAADCWSTATWRTAPSFSRSACGDTLHTHTHAHSARCTATPRSRRCTPPPASTPFTRWTERCRPGHRWDGLIMTGTVMWNKSVSKQLHAIVLTVPGVYLDRSHTDPSNQWKSHADRSSERVRQWRDTSELHSHTEHWLTN